MKRILKLYALSFCLLVPTAAYSQKKLSPSEAKEHIGETATVCGNVESTKYAVSSKRQPTFQNLDKPYPNQIFTVVIWGNNRSKFGRPEAEYRDKPICVTGKITEYRGTPEIMVDEPRQIRVDGANWVQMGNCPIICKPQEARRNVRSPVHGAALRSGKGPPVSTASDGGWEWQKI